jgi:hypothetical protein
MVGIGPRVVKRDLPLRKNYSKSMIFRNFLLCTPHDLSPIPALAIRQVLVDHESGCANNLTGVTRIAM